MRTLPKNVIVKEDGYFLKRTGPGKPISLGETRLEAIDTLKKLRVAGNGANVTAIKDKARKMRDARESLYFAMISRGRSKKVPVLSRTEFNLLWEQAGERCQLTGIPFGFDKPPNACRKPWAPSLDRIDSSLGYTVGNTRLVCTAVNFALNEWGDDVLMRIAEALITNGEMTSRALKVEKILRKAMREIDELR